ncbi:bestrophin family protein [Skeletonema marinoi]|uniref:Bestrophin family protein n=1 Tax=Skeletonema marinoi TaxID=267567 RepID=A0AAD8Y211_9STRA|nr:bestrophin family protein [Skeletonema marinoi]
MILLLTRHTRRTPMHMRLFVASSSVSKAALSSLSSSATDAKFYIPRKERATSNSMYEIDNIYDQRIKRRRRIDPTRELNYTPDHWERHKSVFRRIKHMLTTFGSSPFQRLMFPDFFVTSMIAGSLTYYNNFMVIDASSQLWIDGSGFAAATTAIALMTGFRLNASNARYAEGRKLIGAVHSTSRDLATNTMMWIKLREDKKRMINLIKAFSVAMTFHLNKKGAHHSIRRCLPNFEEQIYAEYQAELLDIFSDDQNEDFLLICNWFRLKENVPLGITTLMRQIIAENEQKDYFTRELDNHVHRLVQSLGGCERIQKTPLPTCFTRHTSRLLWVWSNLLPFAIYPVCGLYTLPTTIAISYSIMGIEDIGVQLEEPFNILPLRQYADNTYDSVHFIESVYASGKYAG